MRCVWHHSFFNCLLSILLIVLVPRVADAQTTLKATVGWGNVVRLGHWMPVFAFVRDTQTRSIDLEVHGSYGKGAGMAVHQTAVAELLPNEFEILFPVNTQLSHIAVLVKDAGSGQTLASQVLEDPSSFSPAGNVPPQVLAPNDAMVGISGKIGDALAVQSQLRQVGVVSGIFDVEALPDQAAGFDGIDTLVLAGCDLRELEEPVQRAMVNWVRAGGNLLVLPGTEPLPASGPLLEALPCGIGVNKSFSFSPGGSSSGASTRPVALNGRELIPKAGAEAISFGSLRGFSRQMGLGKISVCEADVAPVSFGVDADAGATWRALLGGMMEVKLPHVFTEKSVSDEEEGSVIEGPTAADSVGRGARETIAVRHVLQSLDAAGPHGGKPWRHLFLVLVGICFVIGPVDSVLRVYLGQAPRTAFTLLGWVGMVAALGGFVVARPGDEPPVVSTLRLVDQVDQTVVATTDILAVESRRGGRVALAIDPAAWCEPANQAAQFFSADRFMDMHFREDHSGCRPEWLKLEAGEPQSVRAETFLSGPAVILTALRVVSDASGSRRIVGEVKNLSGSGMTDLQIGTAWGVCRVGDGTLGAGASAKVDAALVGDVLGFEGLSSDVGDVSVLRTDRGSQLVKQGWVCVYAEMPGEAGVKVVEAVEAQRHFEVARAVVPLVP
jgi:hypothetical protein